MADPTMVGAQARFDLTPDRSVGQIANELEHHIGKYQAGADVFGFDETVAELLSDAVGSKEKAAAIIKSIAREAATMAVYFRDHKPRKV